MKQIVEVVDGEGLEGLLGKQVILLCANYFYTGKLVGVNETCIKLSDPAIVFDAGDWTEPGYAAIEKMIQKVLYVQLSAIESFGESK